jgi:hypothetical protein
VRQAQAELALAELQLAKSTWPLRRDLHRHRNALILFGGFATGLALTFLPPRWWARIGAAVGATAAGLARSALTPAVVGAVLARVQRSDASATEPTPAGTIPAH